MATALLSISTFLPSKNRDQNGCFGNLSKSSFQGKVSCNRRITSIKGGRSSFFVASLLGRKKAQKKETVIPDPDYRIPIVLLGICSLSLCIIINSYCFPSFLNQLLLHSQCHLTMADCISSNFIVSLLFMPRQHSIHKIDGVVDGETEIIVQWYTVY
ncbi:hypothetical protein LINGRAHAP2_LOCUS2280 [Linum grandiflorum]